MSNNLPNSKPQMTRAEVVAMITEQLPDFILPDFFVCGIRGYYKKSMGDATKNDRKIYDDAIFLISKDNFFAFNANTDPSAFKLQIANLKTGVWPVYKFDLHNGKYLAICQRAGKVTVIRDGKGEDTGNFGINIHKGGTWGTGSLGCQTIPPTQWNDFIDKAQAMAKAAYGDNWKKLVYTYVLLEN